MIIELLKNKILILDGAMGTMLQAYKFSENDFRGERFKIILAHCKEIMTCCQLLSQKQLKLFMENILKLVQIL